MTIAAIATPPGASALGVLRLSGPAALEVAGRFLQTAGSGLAPRLATLGRASFKGAVLDQVIAVYYPAPRSPTGEDLVEITGHGSPYVLGRLLEAALDSGARAALPGEFTQRAFLNGRLDLAQAEAVCDLIRAGTGLAHRAALEQLEGGLSRAVEAAEAPIMDLLVRVEATLDHPEEDVPRVEAGKACAAMLSARGRVLELARTFGSGRLLTEGARVCIAGPPNAGKSSLLNALLGTERAIVCPTPGTTRDTLEEACDLGGIPAVLIDTAGLTDRPEGLAEAQGQGRANRALERCDLALLVLDGSRPQDEEDKAASRLVLDKARSNGRPVIRVLNKADLPRARGLPRCDLDVSAKERTGIDALVLRAAGSLAGEPAQDAGATVTSARHHAALQAAASELASAARATEERPGAWEELAASGLRAALRALDGITGKAVEEEVLSGIFSRFCVGK
ncbi:MAG: tRNA uridine-5-carboxymethylaminomethyl(34) synthesis GTPase MnmE [Elusimicrobia bacterium]|nr:tRNA uridine-5-carboxymethylaminomethyl(34) synthesis GTPase MnmE [Elusimicrobiota bacterium]